MNVAVADAAEAVQSDIGSADQALFRVW